MTLYLRLPWPPSVNHYWRHVGPRVLVSREGRAYRRACHLAMCLQLQRTPDKFSGQVSLTIYVAPPDRRRRDLDNILKALLDALQAIGVYGDDSQVTELYMRRCKPIAQGQVRVEVAQMAERADMGEEQSAADHNEQGG